MEDPADDIPVGVTLGLVQVPATQHARPVRPKHDAYVARIVVELFPLVSRAKSQVTRFRNELVHPRIVVDADGGTRRGVELGHCGLLRRG